MRKLLPFTLLLCLFGCQSEPEHIEITTPPGNVGGKTAVAPIGSGALGGNTPMAGSESLGGGSGGGVAQAAKGQAMGAAAKAAAGSGAQTEDGNE